MSKKSILDITIGSIVGAHPSDAGRLELVTDSNYDTERREILHTCGSGVYAAKDLVLHYRTTPGTLELLGRKLNTTPPVPASVISMLFGPSRPTTLTYSGSNRWFAVETSEHEALRLLVSQGHYISGLDGAALVEGTDFAAVMRSNSFSSHIDFHLL